MNAYVEDDIVFMGDEQRLDEHYKSKLFSTRQIDQELLKHRVNKN